jgi:hypothetical protein
MPAEENKRTPCTQQAPPQDITHMLRLLRGVAAVPLILRASAWQHGHISPKQLFATDMLP